LLHSRYPYIREAAAYALTCMCDGAALEPLLVVATDAREHARVRAQAIEAIGMTPHGDRRRRRFRHTVDALIGLLSDASPHVRFWACYALGQMRATRALPVLRRLEQTDHMMCPGWWLVREEASDAIEWIHGRPGEDRTGAGEVDPIDPNEVRPRVLSDK
jgi:HEAT repeat protein